MDNCNLNKHVDYFLINRKGAPTASLGNKNTKSLRKNTKSLRK